MASKRQRRRDNKSNVWKQDIQTEAEDDVFEAWAAFLEDLPWEVGRWRPCKVAKGKVHRETDIKKRQRAISIDVATSSTCISTRGKASTLIQSLTNCKVTHWWPLAPFKRKVRNWDVGNKKKVYGYIIYMTTSLTSISAFEAPAISASWSATPNKMMELP